MFALIAEFVIICVISDMLTVGRWRYDVNLMDPPGVPRRQPHRRSGLATLPSVGAVP